MLKANSFSQKTSQPNFRLIGLFVIFVIAAISTWILSDPRYGSPPQLKFGKYPSLTTRTDNISILDNIDLHKQPNSLAELNPNDTSAWQQTLQSIITLNKQIAATPKDISLHNRLGILYAQIGDFKAAAKQFNEAISLCRLKTSEKMVVTADNKNKGAVIDQSSPDRSLTYVQLSCAHSNLARIYDKLGDHAAVIRELEELTSDIAFAGDNHSLGKSYVLNANPDLFALTNNQTKLTPTQAKMLARGEALRQVGRLNEASVVFTDLIKSNPKIAIAHQRLGLIAVAENNLWLSINEFETAAKLDKTDPDTENDLGLIYEQIGDRKAAQSAFWQAHKIAPRHLSASINLANSLGDSGNFKAGIDIMRQAIVFHPQSATAYNDLGALIARTSNQTEAAKAFAKAINLNPALPSAHYGLGLALLKLKSYPAAIRELQTAMALNPGILDLQNKIDLANRSNLRSLAIPNSGL